MVRLVLMPIVSWYTLYCLVSIVWFVYGQCSPVSADLVSPAQLCQDLDKTSRPISLPLIFCMIFILWLSLGQPLLDISMQPTWNVTTRICEVSVQLRARSNVQHHLLDLDRAGVDSRDRVHLVTVRDNLSPEESWGCLVSPTDNLTT